MTSPGENYKQYSSLYHDFTEAYANASEIAKTFYPQVKQFVESTEPEIDKYVKKLSGSQSSSAGANGYHTIVRYMNSFDDFTLSANKLFSDLKGCLKNGENIITHVMELKHKHNGIQPEHPDEELSPLVANLSDVLAQMKPLSTRVDELQKQMKKLESDWKKAKVKIQ